jgi:hypothetical protein
MAIRGSGYLSVGKPRGAPRCPSVRLIDKPVSLMQSTVDPTPYDLTASFNFCYGKEGFTLSPSGSWPTPILHLHDLTPCQLHREQAVITHNTTSMARASVPGPSRCLHCSSVRHAFPERRSRASRARYAHARRTYIYPPKLRLIIGRMV